MLEHPRIISPKIPQRVGVVLEVPVTHNPIALRRHSYVPAGMTRSHWSTDSVCDRVLGISWERKRVVVAIGRI